MSSLVIGHLFALTTAFCWAENALIWGYLGKRVGSTETAHIRMWIATPVLFLLARMIDGPIHADIRTWLILLASGCLGYFVTDVAVFQAYVLLGTRRTLVIQTLSPVCSALLSWSLFGERLSPLQMTGLFIALSGIALVIIQQEQETKAMQTKGILFAVFGAIVQSLSLVLTKFALASTGAVTTNTIRALGGLLSLFLFSLIRKNVPRDFSSYRRSGTRLFLLLVLGSLLGPIIGMSSEMQAFRLAPLGTATAIAQSSPVILLIQEAVTRAKRVTLEDALFTLWAVGGIALLFIAD
ncbi:MAG: DMT family transporter [Sphaerochaeta sp.]|jgi:drug/metabolite transporter (DMT)-like permease|nr:DMT family transporter [Sphaerochaeta sp.]